jgi:hypothetical protein
LFTATYSLPALLSIKPCQLSSSPLHPFQRAQVLTFRTKSSMSGIQASSGVLMIPDSSALSEYGSSMAAPQDPRAPSLRSQLVRNSVSTTTRASRKRTYAKSLTLFTFSIPPGNPGQSDCRLESPNRQSTYRQHYRSSARCPRNTCLYRGISAARTCVSASEKGNATG